MSRDDRSSTEIFRKGSRTYFHSTLFFPPLVRREVTTLYAFVRTADDFVDRVPQDAEGFHAFRRAYVERWEKGVASGLPVVDTFCDLARSRRFEPGWTEAFLDSMAMDLEARRYARLEDTLRYVYGSAEVIGMMMARLMGLGDDALSPARLLGRAMQYINFIRDIREDQELGRAYLPEEAWRAAGLSSLAEEEARARPEAFKAFLRAEIARYEVWQAEAERGYPLIPRRFLIPIRTAADMYKWTARRIAADPLVVFRRKVKPSRVRIIVSGLHHFISTRGGAS